MVNLQNRTIFHAAIFPKSELELFKIKNTKLFGSKTISDCFGDFLIPENCKVERVVIHQTNDKIEHILTDIEYKIIDSIVYFKIAAGTEFVGNANFPVDIILTN